MLLLAFHFALILSFSAFVKEIGTWREEGTKIRHILPVVSHRCVGNLLGVGGRCYGSDEILLFVECLLQENIQSKHDSPELMFLSLWIKKTRKSNCWWKCVTSLEG